MKAEDFIIGIDNSNAWDNGPTLVISTVECWKKEQCCSDHYEDDEWDFLYPILDEFCLEELLESVFESRSSEFNMEEIKTELIEKGFTYEKEFEEFITRTGE